MYHPSTDSNKYYSNWNPPGSTLLRTPWLSPDRLSPICWWINLLESTTYLYDTYKLKFNCKIEQSPMHTHSIKKSLTLYMYSFNNNNSRHDKLFILTADIHSKQYVSVHMYIIVSRQYKFKQYKVVIQAIFDMSSPLPMDYVSFDPDILRSIWLEKMKNFIWTSFHLQLIYFNFQNIPQQ